MTKNRKKTKSIKYELDPSKKVDKKFWISYMVILFLEILCGILILIIIGKPISFLSTMEILLFANIVNLLLLKGKEIKDRIIAYLPIIIVPSIALLISYILISRWSTETLRKSEVLAFWGQFLTFFGSFGLGYFIFANENKKRKEKQIEEIEHLADLAFKADIDMYNLRKMTNGVDKNERLKGFIAPISTEKQWDTYYRSYERTYGHDNDLKTAVSMYFSRIDTINNLIVAGKYIEASKSAQDYIDKDFYNTMRFNPGEVSLILSGGALGLPKSRSWLENKENIELIQFICDYYSDVIETYIYSYLIKNNLKTCNSTKLDKLITDQLIDTSPFLKEKIVFPTNKRIVTKAISICSQERFSRGSKTPRVELVWTDYQLSASHIPNMK